MRIPSLILSLLIFCLPTSLCAQAAASSFAAQKGTLPAPISGNFTVQNPYGSYRVGGIELGSKGIFLRGKSGCHARNIYEGKVSAIYQFDSGYCVIVRHGTYLSVYHNLEEPNVKVGQTVKKEANLGRVARNALDERILHFQLRQEREPLNPLQWLKL